jgi:adenylate cyclase
MNSVEPQVASPRKPRLRRPFSLATGLGALFMLAGLLFAPSLAPWLMRFDHWTADWRTAYLSPAAQTPHPLITLVTITDETLKDLPSSPIDRGLLAQLIRAIDAAQPKAIAVDIFFLKRTEPQKDADLQAALRSARAPIILGAIDERGGLSAERWQFQSEFLASTGRPAGYLNLRTEKDGVVRYAARPAPSSQYPKSWPTLIAETSGVAASGQGGPIRWTLPGRGGTPVFETLLAHDVLAASSNTHAQRLKDKLVLIGGDFEQPPRDRHRVPLSVRNGNAVPGVTIHAHILAALLDPATAVRELDDSSTRILLVGLGVAGFVIGWTLSRSPLVGLSSWTAATVILLALDAIAFTQFNLLLPFTLALVAWFAGVTAGSALRAVARAMGRAG